MAYPPRPRRWIYIVLIVSLTLNMLVVGAVVGFAGFGRHKHPGFNHHHSAKGPPHRSRSPMSQAPPLLPAIAFAKSRPERRAFARQITEKQEDLGLNPAASMAIIDAMRTVLTTPPYDAAAMDALFAAQRDNAMVQLDAVEQVLRQELAQMSDTQRAAVAEGLGRRYTFRRGQAED